MPSTALRPSRAYALLMVSLCASFGLGASCRRPAPPAAAAVTQSASIRLYFLADLDGYLEPCGCQARPLGGIDRVATLIERERAAHPNSLLVATGNLFYEHPTLEAQMVFQERARAESLGPILERLQLAAWAPGPSDYALGAEGFQAAARNRVQKRKSDAADDRDQHHDRPVQCPQLAGKAQLPCGRGKAVVKRHRFSVPTAGKRWLCAQEAQTASCATGLAARPGS